MKDKVAVVLAVIILLGTPTACTQRNVVDQPAAQPGNIEGNYQINILIVRGSNEQYLEPYQHLINTVHVNANVEVVNLFELLEQDLSNVDVVYPDTGLLEQQGREFQQARELLQLYVAEGGNLLLEHDFYTVFPSGFLGVKEFASITDCDLGFQYPEVSADLVDLQQVYREFASNVDRYDLLEDRHIHFDVGAVVDTAQPLVVHSSGLALLIYNDYGKGSVMWTNRFLPNRDCFISRLDFRPTREGQEYFHFGYASANWLFRTKYLNTIAKQKYGFALEKVMGPYTRPGISWQNHFEVLHAFPRNDMTRFIELLREYQQIPSFSLIRGTYDWGVWKGVVVWNKNVASDGEPQLLGEADNSFYSTGERITYQDGTYLELGKNSGYNTLLSELDAPTRAYPQVVDLNGDGKRDLLVGTADGEIVFFPNSAESSSSEPVFVNEVVLQAAGQDFPEFAAPAAGDLNHDGLIDLVVGGKQGELFLYLNRGTKAEPKFIFASTIENELGLYTAPHLVDWNGDGALDLLVGSGEGCVWLLTGTSSSRLQFGSTQLLIQSTRQWVAPHAVDWNGDGALDVLLGGYDGEVELYLGRPNGILENTGKLKGHNYNFFGDKNIHIGHNSVPVVADWDADGDLDLILGGLEYGPARPIDSPALPYRNALQRSIRYCLDNFLPISVHLYAHEYKTSAEERRELELHWQAFENLGIPWQDMGINHHTWRANCNTLQTLLNEQDFDIFFNFGFHPYGSVGQPRDGRSFAPIVAPFRLIVGDKVEPFVFGTVVPNVFTYAQAVDSMLCFDLPITNFEHVEYRLDPGTKYYESLVRTIERLQQLQKKGCYNFVTEQQQAKALLNMYYTKLNVQLNDNGFFITQDTSDVPEQAGEYRGCVGVRVSPGSKFAEDVVASDALIQHKPGNGHLYIGVLEGAEVTWNEHILEPELTIVRSNVPIQVVRQTEKQLVLKLNSQAMQQIVLQSKGELKIEGPDLIIEREGQNYTVTHYGDVVTVIVRTKR